jgi:nitrite reductase/ring-hydroxylating ferredoxin subunit
MPEVFVEKVANFAEGDRGIVFHGGLDIGVFHWQGNFCAYENLCLHRLGGNANRLFKLGLGAEKLAQVA